MRNYQLGLGGLVLAIGFIAVGAQAQKTPLGIEVPKDPKAFMERLHFTNQHEIKVGQLAQQKGQNPAVKQYGQLLVTEHQKMDQELMTQAQQQKMKLGDEPSRLTSNERKIMDATEANMEKLQVLEGPAFDQAFLANMVGDHDLNIARTQAGLQQFGDNPQLVSQLQKTLPRLMQHRDRAYRLLGQVTTGVGGAGAGPREPESPSGAPESPTGGAEQPAH